MEISMFGVELELSRDWIGGEQTIYETKLGIDY